jgi:DNA-binding NtrC family response regulator
MPAGKRSEHVHPDACPVFNHRPNWESHYPGSVETWSRPQREQLYIPIVTGDGDIAVLTAAQPALAPSPLRVLLVGKKEEDFFLIREILERMRSSLAADLDHAHTIAEAKAMLQWHTYGLVLLECDTGDAEAVHLVSEFLHAGVAVPFILLTEEADEKTVAELIHGGSWNCVARSQLDGATLVRTIRTTLAVTPCNRSSNPRKSLYESYPERSNSPPTLSSSPTTAAFSNM